MHFIRQGQLGQLLTTAGVILISSQHDRTLCFTVPKFLLPHGKLSAPGAPPQVHSVSHVVAKGGAPLPGSCDCLSRDGSAMHCSRHQNPMSAVSVVQPTAEASKRLHVQAITILTSPNAGPVKNSVALTFPFVHV